MTIIGDISSGQIASAEPGAAPGQVELVVFQAVERGPAEPDRLRRDAFGRGRQVAVLIEGKMSAGTATSSRGAMLRKVMTKKTSETLLRPRPAIPPSPAPDGREKGPAPTGCPAPSPAQGLQ